MGGLLSKSENAAKKISLSILPLWPGEPVLLSDCGDACQERSILLIHHQDVIFVFFGRAPCPLCLAPSMSLASDVLPMIRGGLKYASNADSENQKNDSGLAIDAQGGLSYP
jgi:hypothetical protein